MRVAAPLRTPSRHSALPAKTTGFVEVSMRSFVTFCAVLLLCVFASGQAGFGHGHSSWDPPGLYSEPFQPLVTTPFVSINSVSTPVISLDSVAPVVGASNATIESSNIFAQFAWAGSQTLEVQQETSTAENETLRQSGGFDFGAARFPSDYGAAQLIERPGASQAKLYTNPDVEAVNQTNGLVKFKGRTEHLD